MNIIIRIAGVWLIMLVSLSLFIGGYGDFGWFVGMFYIIGLFMTVPAIITLAIAAIIETTLIRFGLWALAFTVGPIAIGVGVPGALHLFALSNGKSGGGIYYKLVPITMPFGILWSLSLLTHFFATRLRQTADKAPEDVRVEPVANVKRRLDDIGW